MKHNEKREKDKSDMDYYLEYKEEGSNKFWKLALQGSSFTVTYGKIGTAGTAKTKTFADDKKAKDEAEKLVKSKRNKGYNDAADAGEPALKESQGEAPTESQEGTPTESPEETPIGLPEEGPTMDGFFAELFPNLEEMEKELQDKFWDFYEKEGASDYHLEDHDPTWTGFIDRIRISMKSIKKKKDTYNYVTFDVGGKWSPPAIRRDFLKFYNELMDEENLNKVIAPRIILWVQERIDKEKYSGFYSAYVTVSISAEGKEYESYQTEPPLLSEARRNQVRAYIKRCVEIQDYSEWKTMEKNPAHLEILWLYKELDLKQIKAYFKRIQNLNRNDTSLYYLYPGYEWQVRAFYESLLEDPAFSMEDCKKLYDFNQILKTFIDRLEDKEEYQPCLTLYERLGFSPETQQKEISVQKISLVDDAYNAIMENYDLYAGEFAREREDVFKGRRRAQEGEALPCWSKEGLAIAFLEVTVLRNKILLWGGAYDWNYHVGNRGEDFEFSADLENEYDLSEITDTDKQSLFDLLIAHFQKIISEDTKDLYLPLVNVSLYYGERDQTQSYWVKGEYTKNISVDGSGEWLDTLQKMHDNMVAPQEKAPQPYSNMLRVFRSIYIHILHYSWPDMLLFMKKYAATQDGVHFGDSMLWNMALHLEGEMKKLLKRKGIDNLRSKITAAFTADEVEFIRFSADLIKENRTESHEKDAQKFAAMLEKLLGKIKVIEEAAPETKPAENYEIQQEKEQEREDLFDAYKDGFVELKSVYYEDGREDYFQEGYHNRGFVECTVLKEEEQSYQTALEYLIRIIKEGFPARFDFSLESGVENFTPVYINTKDETAGLQCGSNQFFTNALQYSGLRDLVREYVKISAGNICVLEESELEEDDSISGRRPDFLAAAALVLSDPSGYDYLTTFNVFSESVHFDQSYNGCFSLANSFMKQCGVTDDNIDNVIKSFKEGKSGLLIMEILEDWAYLKMEGYKEIAGKLLAHLDDNLIEMGLDERLTDLLHDEE